jgi:hypothetical protein
MPFAQLPIAVDASCVHGEDGHYYCTHVCAYAARELGLAQVLELRSRQA